MKSFKLEIVTPQEQFLTQTVEAVTVNMSDGELTVLAGHAPMIAALDLGLISFKYPDGEWHEAYGSEGFMEVRPDEVLIFVRLCVWAEDVDASRVKEEMRRAFEKMRYEQSLMEHHQNVADLKRMLVNYKKGSGNLR